MTRNIAWKKTLALVLAVMLALTTTPVTALPVYAQEGNCTHAHDEACGYAEGVDCDHSHDESCGEDGVDCAHAHDESCSYIAAAPCGHEHDENCGGLAADSTGSGEGNDPATPTEAVVLGFSTPTQVATVPLGTSYADLPLPETLAAELDGESEPTDIPVSWADDDGYDGYAPGDYGFTGQMGAGYILDSGVNAPAFTVKVEGVEPDSIMPLALEDYSAGDVAVINAIIDNNGLGWTKDAPDSWPTSGAQYVVWSSVATDKRITRLYINNCGLTGALDVSGLTSLAELYCSSNNLDTLDVSGLTGLADLRCSNNNLTELALSGLANLRQLVCNDNNLTELEFTSEVFKIAPFGIHNNPLERVKATGAGGWELIIPLSPYGSVVMTDLSYGDTVTLTATATEQNYAFNSWTGDQTGTNNPITFTINNDMTVTAVYKPINALAPTISGHPQGSETYMGGTVAPLSVTASSVDGGALSYQWYSNTTNSNSGGSPISGANAATYAPPTGTAGTFYYYVVVTNTNNDATSTKTATAASNAATVKVNPDATVAVTPPANITYGGTLGNPSATASAGGNSFTYEYSGTIADGAPYGPIATKPTLPGSYTVTATLVSATHQGNGAASFTIGKKTLTWNTDGRVFGRPYDRTTAATLQTSPTLIGIINADDVTVTNGTVAFSSANAGASVSVTASGWNIGGTNAAYYTVTGQPTFAPAAISKINLTWNADGTVNNKPYDGTTAATVATMPTLNGVISGDTVPITTGTVTFADANVGTHAVIATGWGIQANANYTAPAAQPVFASANITKATVTPTNQTMKVLQGRAHTYTFPLTNLLPAGADPAQVSAYKMDGTGGATAIFEATPGISGTTLTVEIAATASTGDIATITIGFTSGNYDIADATITVEVTDKSPVTVSGVTAADKTYDGTAFAYTGSVKFTDIINNTDVTGDLENEFVVQYSSDGGGTWSPNAPTDAGDYRMQISVDGHATYDVTPLVTDFTIHKAALTITADNKTAKQGDPLPTVTIRYSGFVGADNETNAFATTPVAAHSATDTNIPGGYSINFTTQAVLAKDNYTMSHVSGTLTVSPKSSACNVLGITSPAGATISGTNITAAVGNSIANVTVNVTVSPDATWALYSNAACTVPITGAWTLAVGANTAYIKVTAENGTTKVYTLTVTRDAVVTYTVSVSANLAAGGSVSGGGSVTSGSSHTVTATANNGYTFQNWTEGGTVVSNSASYTFTVSGNRTLVANFNKDSSSGGDNPGGSSGSDSDSGSSRPDTSAYISRTLTHTGSGVKVSGTMAPGAALTVNENTLHTEASGCAACAAIRAQLGAGNVLVLYDISISGGYRGSVEVSIPVGSEYDGQALTVLHCLDHELESRELTAKDGYVTGTFTSLSPFAVLKPDAEGAPGTDANAENPETGGDTSNPQTGDDGPHPLWWLWILIPAAALTIGIGFIIWRRRKGRAEE